MEKTCIGNFEYNGEKIAEALESIETEIDNLNFPDSLFFEGNKIQSELKELLNKFKLSKSKLDNLHTR